MPEVDSRLLLQSAPAESSAAIAARISDAAAFADQLPVPPAERETHEDSRLSPENLSASARQLLELAVEKLGKGQKVAVLFGPERAGLENDDIARANAIISVPVNPDFPSLNLAQCVLLTAYEWRRQTGSVAAETIEFAGTEVASQIEVEKLAEHFEDRLSEAGFFFPETKAEGMKTTLRNLWSRMPLTRADVQILHGIMRQMVRWKERGQ